MNQYSNISTQEAYKMLHARGGAILLDVRREDEYKVSHIPHSVHIPLDQLEKNVEDEIKDKSATIIVYCRSGVRSKVACENLLQLGYTTVYNMLGGILAYQYELETPNHS